MFCFVFIRITIKINHLHLLTHTLNVSSIPYGYDVVLSNVCNLLHHYCLVQPYLSGVYIMMVTFKCFLCLQYDFAIKQTICIVLKHKSSFYYTFFVPLAFLCSVSSIIKYAYVFARSPTNS